MKDYTRGWQKDNGRGQKGGREGMRGRRGERERSRQDTYADPASLREDAGRFRLEAAADNPPLSPASSMVAI